MTDISGSGNAARAAADVRERELRAALAAKDAEIERLQSAKRRALAIADERAKEAAELRAELAKLREAQWPSEVTDEMVQAVYALDLGKNRLSLDDVIDIYDTFKRVHEQSSQTAGKGWP